MTCSLNTPHTFPHLLSLQIRVMGSIRRKRMIFLSTQLFPLMNLSPGHLYMCLPLLVHAVVSSMLNDKPLQFHTHALYRRLLHQWIQKQLMIFLLLFVKVIVSAFILSSFVSYNHLSSSTCSFITSLEFVSILKTVDEALSQPGLWDLYLE